MRVFVFVLVLALAACGGSDPTVIGGGESCSQATSDFHAVTSQPQPCSVDSDCTLVLDNCFGPSYCAVYVNRAHAAAALSALQAGQSACSMMCGECMPGRPPACVAGVCGPSPPPQR